VNGFNQNHSRITYTVTVQPTGTVDLNLLKNDAQLDDSTNQSKGIMSRMKNILRVFSIVTRENCSSRAAFAYNRIFFTHDLDDRHNTWNIGSGKTLWRGFFTSLVLGDGQNKLLMNLDGKNHISENTCNFDLSPK
jgi:hypothetical protein